MDGNKGMWDGNGIEDMGLVQNQSFSGKGGVVLTNLEYGFNKSSNQLYYVIKLCMSNIDVIAFVQDILNFRLFKYLKKIIHNNIF